MKWRMSSYSAAAIVFIGDAEVRVKFDYEAAEEMTRDHPGCPSSVTINELLINDQWISPEYFDSDLIDRLECSICEDQETSFGERDE